MADNQGGSIVQTELTADVTGFVNATKEIKKATDNISSYLSNVDKQVQTLTKHFEALQKGWNGSITAPNMLQKGTSRQSVNYNGVSIDQSGSGLLNKATMVQTYQQAQDEARKNGKADRRLTRAIEERAKAEADLTKEILKQKQKYGAENQANKTRNSNTNALNAQNRKRYLDSQKDWLAYRNEHPEQFVSGRYNSRYQIGGAISDVGSMLSQKGGGGRIAGDLMQIGGSFIISRAMGVATLITKAASAVNDFTTAITDSYKDIEATKAQLSVVYNSRSMSDSAFQDISQYAVKSPFGIEQTSEMAILLKQSGVYSVDLLDTLKMIGDTAGGDMEKMKRIANNYAQIVSIGKASMLDMRQFAYAGIPIFEAVSKELGVTQQELRKLVSDGKVTSEIIEKVFKDLTGVNGVFENAVEVGAKTLKARSQNLEDAKKLALAEVGERFNKIGEKTGGDSLTYKFLNLSEQFYQGLSKWMNGSNVERDVKTLTQNRSKIAQYEALLELAKANGDTIQTEYIEAEIKKLKNQISIEDERAINLASYNLKYSSIEDARRKGDELKFGNTFALIPVDEKAKEWGIENQAITFNELLEKLGGEKAVVELSNTLSYVDSLKEQAIGSAIYSGVTGYFSMGSNIPLDTINTINSSITNTMIDEYFEKVIKSLYPDMDDKAVKDFWNSSRAEILSEFRLIEDYVKDYSKAVRLSLTDGENLAHYENVTMVGQEQGYSDVNKASDKSDSIVNVASEIKVAWEQSVEQQKKAEEEKKSLWLKTQELLREIDKNTDENGVVDQSKLTAEQLLNYVNKGAVVGTKLNVVNTENAQVMAENRPMLYSQYVGAMQKVFNTAAGQIPLEVITSLKVPFDEFKHKMAQGFETDKDFYVAFNESFAEQTDTINEALKNPNLSDEERNLYERMLTLLNVSTLKLTADTSMKDVNLEELFDKFDKEKSADTFIPLWKRILSSSTGVSASAITGTEQTLDFYHENLSTRNITGNVLTELLKDGMVASNVRKLTSYRTGQATVEGDTGTTWQIDWTKTREEMSKFVNQIGVSTKGIEAWVNGLQGEMETYQNLLGSGILTPETDGVKQARYINAKQMDKNWISEGEQGVNAFGEVLKNADGEVVASIKDGIAYDAQGNALQNQQLEITGNIYDALEKHMQEVKEEIKESSETLTKNTILNNLASQSYQTNALSSFMRGGYEVSNFALNNPELAMSFMRPLEDSEKEHFGVNNALELYAKGLAGDTEALMLFRKLTDGASQKLKEFIGSDEYQALNEEAKKTAHKQEIQTATNKYNEIVKNPSSWLGFSEDDTNPDHQNGLAGLQHRLVDKGVLEGLGISGVSISEIASEAGVDESLVRQQLAAESMKNSLKEAAESMEELGVTAAKGLFLAPFETLGESLGDLIAGTKTWEETLDDAKTKMRAIAGQMLSSLGTTLTECGLNIASAAAMEHSWGMVAAGLGLAALGGVASGFGSWLQNDDSDNDEEDDKVEKLKDLKEGLADLLEQARSDALYYEKNLRHKTALGTNSSYSYQKVNDAIIAPNGNVISTAPDDYLIATKTPQNFANNQTSVKINNIVNNNAGVQVKQEQRKNSDGSIDIITTLEESIGSYIASEKSDNAFMARELRMKGVASVM